MSRHHSHIASAIKIIVSASAGEPLAHHLKKFFAADKKFGSKDRKAISSLCYNYYRLGNALKDKTAEERILAGCFLGAGGKSDLLDNRAPELNEKMHWSREKKLAFLKITGDDIFIYSKALSNEIDVAGFVASFSQQPLFFLRIRPGKATKVLEKLTAAKAEFTEISTSCIALPPASKTDELIKLNKDAVVQDLNSQQVFNYLQQDGVFLSKDATVWDCCAGSGGKSILLYDMLHGHASLHVSDVRENILHNLRNRFKDAGILNYQSFLTDLSAENVSLPGKQFELIICDAPCTGSGTWARNPEQLIFFDEKAIDEYAEKQKKIAATAARALKPGGLFFYITCSGF
ncbi:MAG: Fmu (Sun) domain-containing protein [Ferruginibacter sp.]